MSADGPVVLVTGSSGGIGAATVDAFAAAGCCVYAGHRRAPGPAAGAAGRRGGIVPVDLELDLRSPGAIGGAVDRVLAETGRIDVLVNNAGVFHEGSLEDTDDPTAEEVLAVNVLAPFRLARAVLPAMRARRRGVIVNVSSVSGFLGSPFSALYAASKHALEAMTESLHLEVAPFGISTVVVEPGGVDTAIEAKALTPAAPTAAYDDALRRMRALRTAAPRLSSAAVADAIAAAALSPTPPVRLVAGAEARRLRALRDPNDDAVLTPLLHRLWPS